MPQMSNIVMNDAAAPAVSHTFKPMSLRNDLGTYQDSASGAVQTWPTITISVRPATSANSGHKTTLRVVTPHAVTDESGTCCVPRGTPLPFSQVTVEFIRSNQADAADVNDLLKYLQQIVLDNQFVLTAKGESLR